MPEHRTPSQPEVKKILCDNAVIAMATACLGLCKAGAFNKRQLESLSKLDSEYVEKAFAIALEHFQEDI